MPLTWKGGTNGFSSKAASSCRDRTANHRQVSPGYMETMGMTLRQGRYFSEQDGRRPAGRDHQRDDGPPCTGRARVRWASGSGSAEMIRRIPGCTIVGVVADVKQMGLEAPGKAEMYFPYSQMADSFWAVPARSDCSDTSDPMRIAAAVRQAIWSVDRDQPVSNIRTMEEILGEEMIQRRIGMTLLGCVCRSGSAAGVARHLRRAFLGRRPADAGDRHPHGTRRSAAARAEDGHG